jgi:hypothetical protein
LADKTAAEGENFTSSRLTTANSATAEKANARRDRTIETRSWLFLCKNKERRYGVLAVS